MKKMKYYLPAIIIWVLGIPASFLLAYDIVESALYRTVETFQYWHFIGYLVLFFALGTIAFLLGMLIKNLNQKSDNKAIVKEENSNE